MDTPWSQGWPRLNSVSHKTRMWEQEIGVGGDESEKSDIRMFYIHMYEIVKEKFH